MSWQAGNPLKSGMYLVTIQYPNGHTQVASEWYRYDDGPHIPTVVHNGCICEVLAWQPLPEPYRVVETRDAPPPFKLDPYVPVDWNEGPQG